MKPVWANFMNELLDDKDEFVDDGTIQAAGELLRAVRESIVTASGIPKHHVWNWRRRLLILNQPTIDRSLRIFGCLPNRR